MKKLIIALSLAATFVATKSEAQTNSTAKSTEKGTKELVILHTNDTHSCIYPL
ncbi:MAG: bifunctional metallophosphatase/5'-nucleotidase, partial [Prevotella nanceiensis]|nr:bifunctional metallophosphatase/5'-nucleotidase [Hoylesella nanceiensis]